MTLLKNLSVYTVSSLISRATPFFLLPVMTAYLTPVQYGVVAVVLSLTVLVSSPLFCGVHSYINIEYFSMDNDAHKKLVNTLCLFPLVLFFPLTLAFSLYAFFGGERWSIPSFWFVCVPFLALLTYFYRLLTILYRAREQSKRYGVLEVFYSLLQVIAAILLVVVFQMQMEGRLLSIVAASFIMSLVCIWQLRKMGYLQDGVDFTLVPDAFRYGVKIIPHELGQQTIRMADRLFVAGIAGAAAAGLYAVAAQVASIALAFIAVFNLAWQPYVFRILSSQREDAKIHLVKLSRYIVCGFIAFFVVLYAAIPFIYRYFIADIYASSLGYVFLLLAGYFFLALYTLVCDYIFYVKKSIYLSIITSVNLILMIVLNVILLKIYGAIGAAYAFAVSSFITFLCAYFISNHVYKMPWFD